MSLALGVPYMMRFRQQDLSAGHDALQLQGVARRPGRAVGWDLQSDIPDWPGTTGQRSGSAVLLAHEADATFGNATVTPLARSADPVTMKIAFVSHPGYAVLPPAGSVEIGTREIARRLAERHDVTIFGSARRRTRDATDGGHPLPLHRSRRDARLARVLRPLYRLRAGRQGLLRVAAEPAALLAAGGARDPPRRLRRRARRQPHAGAAGHPAPEPGRADRPAHALRVARPARPAACSTAGCATPT